MLTVLYQAGTPANAYNGGDYHQYVKLNSEYYEYDTSGDFPFCVSKGIFTKCYLDKPCEECLKKYNKISTFPYKESWIYEKILEQIPKDVLPAYITSDKEYFIDITTPEKEDEEEDEQYNEDDSDAEQYSATTYSNMDPRMHPFP